MKFKVGDRVRVLADGCLKGCEADVVETIGEKITITSGVVLGYFNKDDLEIIQPSKKTTLEELEKRLEKLEKCVMSEQKSLQKSENKPIYERNELFSKILKEEIAKNSINLNDKKSLLTEDERVILRNLDKRAKWIARDTKELTIFEEKPEKRIYYWGVNNVKLYVASFECYNHLFQFIKWTDNEPYNIEELLKGESDE